MSSDLLREAAAKMRERAEAATPGPWEARHGGYSWIALYDDEDSIPEGESLPSFEPGGSATPADAEHIASWHPAVALAVADWLERAADEPWCCDECKFGPDHPENVAHGALAVARAYLGRDA